MVPPVSFLALSAIVRVHSVELQRDVYALKLEA